MRERSVTALIVSLEPGDFYRAGRTLRAINALSLRNEVRLQVIDASAFDSAVLASRLKNTTHALWVLRAGCWLRSTVQVCFPEQSQTGRAVLALGACTTSPDQPDAEPASYAWREILAQTGGELSAIQSSSKVTAIPIESLYIAPELVAQFKALLCGTNLSSALQSLFRVPEARCFRFAPLDVVQDARLRVAEVITSLQRGGAERVVLDLHATLPSRGMFSKVITTGRSLRKEFRIPRGTIDVSTADGGRTGRMKAAAEAARQMQADVVHAHLLHATDLAYFRAAGLPVLATIHNAREGWIENTENLRRSDVDVLVACSQSVESDVLAASIDVPVRTAWNGIDLGTYVASPELTARATTLRQTWGIPTGDAVLIALANPRRQKRLHLLPEILRYVRSKLHSRDAWLVIVGETSGQNSDAQKAERELMHAIESSGQTSRIVRVPGTDDVAAILYCGDLLISVSAWEGLSLAHLEAISAGCAVVATAVGGTSEILPRAPSLKLVAPDADAESIAGVVVNVLGEAREHRTHTLQTDFCRFRMAERYASLLPRAIAQHGRVNDFPKSNEREIWLVTNNFSIGGAQSSARRLLTGLKRRGVTVRAVVVQEQIAFPTPGRLALEADGIPVIALPPSHPMGQNEPLSAVSILLELIDRAGRTRPQSVVMWNLVQQYKVLLADLLLDVLLFDVSPGEMYFASLEKYFHRPRPGLPYRTAREYGSRLAGVVVKYEAERTLAEVLLGTRVSVVPNGMPVLPRAEKPRGSRLVFGTSARLSPQKKLEELFAAFRLASASLPPYALRVAGSPEYGSETYAEELKRKGADIPIEWLGQVDDMPAFLSTLDVFTMISEPAGCPNASLEAMAAGLPVIATDVGGAGEQVVDGVTGRLLPRGDTDAFADALKNCAENPETLARWGSAGRARIEKHFSLESMVEEYQRIFSANG